MIATPTKLRKRNYSSYRQNSKGSYEILLFLRSPLYAFSNKCRIFLNIRKNEKTKGILSVGLTDIDLLNCYSFFFHNYQTTKVNCFPRYMQRYVEGESI